MNAVKKKLCSFPQIQLRIIDFAQHRTSTRTKILQEVDTYNPELIITYRCPLILPKEVFSKPLYGAYNIHPSLLPKYPGLNPWEDIFRNHEREGGVSICRITENVDAGPIYCQEPFIIEESDTIASAREKADGHAARLITKLIDHFLLQNHRIGHHEEGLNKHK